MVTRDVTKHTVENEAYKRIYKISYYIHPSDSRKYFTFNTDRGIFIALAQNFVLANKSCVLTTDCPNY